MNDDALNADAALARLIKGAKDDPLDGILDVGILVDDHCGIAAKLQHHLLLAGSGLEVPADARGPREGEELQPIVPREEIGAVPARGEDRKGALGKLGLGQHLADDDRAERRSAGGLHHERAAHRDGGSDLVRGEVQREVERRDEAARPDRHALPHALIAACALGNIERLHFPRQPNRFFRSDAEGVDEPRHFAFGIVDRFSGLDAERISKFVEARLEPLHAMLEHGLALIACHARHRLGGAGGGRNAFADRLLIGERAAKGHLARIFVGDGEVAVGLPRLAPDVKRVDVLELGHSSVPGTFELRLPKRLRPEKATPHERLTHPSG